MSNKDHQCSSFVYSSPNSPKVAAPAGTWPVAYHCYDCGKPKQADPWPCADLFGDVEDRAAGIPVSRL